MADTKENSQYEVLSPWSETDPIPLKGISPRLADMNNKTIGLLVNGKRASAPIQEVVEARLKERFPTLKFSRFGPTGNREVNETADKNNLQQWIKGVDAVVTAVGD
jgi:hypothetical protein